MAGGLPPCGIYRTTEAIGQVPAGRLVFFHNHGDPGPGIYLPERWSHNRAHFSQRGTTLQDLAQAATLQPLLAEGLYRVEEPFTCCDRDCRTYPIDTLVQLGYDGNATPILFTPTWTPDGLAFPTRGQRVDALRLSRLGQLLVGEDEKKQGHRYH